jgi:hypothetical protein
VKETPADKAQQKYIERNDIVVQVAKIIDPGAFSAPWRNLDTGEEVDATRTRYKQACALSKASEVLKLASKQKKLREALVESEIEFWAMIGMDHPAMAEQVRLKYASE